MLVVEDDPIARRAITLILRRQGFVPSEAGTVAEARRALAAADAPPEWLLLDLMLPDGYGTDILCDVRFTDSAAAPARHPPRVCVITGCGSDLVTEARLLGAEQVLTKPLDVERLIELLSAAAVR